jgi:hypothetical protein
MVKPMTTGEMGVEPGWWVLLAVLDGATSIWRGWGTAPLTVILRFLGDGGMSAEGAGAASSSGSWLSCLTRTSSSLSWARFLVMMGGRALEREESLKACAKEGRDWDCVDIVVVLA